MVRLKPPNQFYCQINLTFGCITRNSYFRSHNISNTLIANFSTLNPDTIFLIQQRSFVSNPLIRNRFANFVGLSRTLRKPFSAVAKMENVEVVGKVLDGKLIASDIHASISKEAAQLKSASGIVPGLAIVQVGDRADSNVYIRMKTKTAGEVGINAQHVKLSSSINEAELLQKIEELNTDSSIHGIIVQLPLDCKETIDASKATDAILPAKDVDGLHTTSAGYLARGELKKCFIPCTPRGCLELIKRSGRKIEGSRAVVLGRSKIVGSPMAELLIWNHATVTVCHSKTVDLPSVIREADILIVAIGKPKFVLGDWIKPGAVVIDCGINVIPDDKTKSGQRIIGDVDYESAKKVASYITPVPGGVGPMTVAMLLQNTIDSAVKSTKK